jgi:B12-binding domain/radical SAM domain protein
MPQTDLILLRAPNIYDFRKLPILHMPQSDSETFHIANTTLVDFLAVVRQFEKTGRHARIVDLSYRMARSKRFDVSSFISKLVAPVFAIEMNDIVQAMGALEVARLIKKYHPESRAILCGCTASSFFSELITFPQVDGIMQGGCDEMYFVLLLKAAETGKFGKVPNLVWKEKRGRVRENELSAERASTDLNIAEYYKGVVSQILSYRDFDSADILKRWLRHPEVGIFKTGYASFFSFPDFETREFPASIPLAFRMPENVYRDIVEVCRFSPDPVSIKGDIRMPGKHYAERFLSLLQHRPVANSLTFELSDAAPSFLIQEIARAAPGFRLNIAPGSHDEIVRKRLGYSYSNKELESTIAAALKARARCVEVLFLVGLPGQTAESVIDTTAYCEYLLRRFDGDRRLSVSIGPCLETPNSAFCGSHESCGFKPRFGTFEQRLNSLALPGWKDRLEYQTAEMSAEHIVAATYDALIRLVRLKGKYGQFPYREVEDTVANYARGMEMSSRLDEIVKNGRTDEMALLNPEIDRINHYNVRFRRRLGLPLMLSRPQNMVALWKAMANNSPWQRLADPQKNRPSSRGL